MAGRKFGSSGSEWLTWAMNAHVPALVAERIAASRIVAFSTACVYPFVDVAGAAPTESAPLTPPPGEYANSCVARERMFQHFSHARGTPGRLIRLSYAIDMRYGVLHDVARKLVRAPADRPDDGPRQRHLAGRRQRLGAARARRIARHRRSGLNVSGPALRIRDAGAGAGAALGRAAACSPAAKQPRRGWWTPARRNACSAHPRCRSATMLDWTADWVARDMASLGKPTHYEARDGKY